MATHDCQVAGVITDAFLLLEATVVFFIEYDDAGIGHRREQGRAGADNDGGLTAAGLAPSFESLIVG